MRKREEQVILKKYHWHRDRILENELQIQYLTKINKLFKDEIKKLKKYDVIKILEMEESLDRKAVKI